MQHGLDYNMGHFAGIYRQGDMPKSTLAGKTIREVIRPSIGGDTIRLRLSNFHSTEPVEIKQIYIAWSVDTVVKDAKTGRIITDNGSTPYIYKDHAAFLTFAGQLHVTIAAGANVTSDAIPFRVRPMRNLAITITYGGMVPEHATSHQGRGRQRISLRKRPDQPIL